MAIRKLKDGRWACYYRVKTPEGSKLKWEYFGRGSEGEYRARQRDLDLFVQRHSGRFGEKYESLLLKVRALERFDPDAFKKVEKYVTKLLFGYTKI